MNMEGAEPHVYLLKYQMRDRSQREIKGTGNMFISLLEKSACWKFEVPEGH